MLGSRFGCGNQLPKVLADESATAGSRFSEFATCCGILPLAGEYYRGLGVK